MFCENLKKVFPLAYAKAPCGVAYYQGKGWRQYDLRLGPGDGVPEFMILKQGFPPIALNDTAKEAWKSLLRAS